MKGLLHRLAARAAGSAIAARSDAHIPFANSRVRAGVAEPRLEQSLAIAESAPAPIATDASTAPFEAAFAPAPLVAAPLPRIFARQAVSIEVSGDVRGPWADPSPSTLEARVPPQLVESGPAGDAHASSFHIEPSIRPMDRAPAQHSAPALHSERVAAPVRVPTLLMPETATNTPPRLAPLAPTTTRAITGGMHAPPRDEPNEVHIHIGRIEVTAVHEPAAPRRRPRHRRPHRCRSSEYFAKRGPDMSTALAIAGVTAVLRDLLNDGLINHNVSGMLGSSVTVSVLAPDRVVPANGTEASQINLFLYLVTPNPGWRNEQLPSRDATGRLRLANAPLALDLHYLLSVYSGGDLHAEILLGYAMQLLHEMPVLTRDAIRTALNPSPDVGAALPPALRALVDSGLEDQVELIKLTPQYLNTEEMSKLWTAMQSHFRPTAAYTASVVLIEATAAGARAAAGAEPRAGRSGHGRDRGVVVNPGLVPPVPMLTAIVPPAAPARRAHRRHASTCTGTNLDGTNREVRLVNDRFDIDATVPALAPPANGADALVQFRARPVACRRRCRSASIA